MTEKQEHAARNRKLVAQYKTTFSSPEGQAVLADLVNNNYIKNSTFSVKSARLTTLREGQRNVILRILALLEVDPEKFLNQPEEELSHVP